MKYWLFAVFSIASFLDAALTDRLLRFDGVMEANPLMVAAMNCTPFGMLLVKAGVCVALLIAWKFLTRGFLTGIAVGMSAIATWNAGLFIWVAQNA